MLFIGVSRYFEAKFVRFFFACIFCLCYFLHFFRLLHCRNCWQWHHCNYCQACCQDFFSIVTIASPSTSIVQVFFIFFSFKVTAILKGKEMKNLEHELLNVAIWLKMSTSLKYLSPSSLSYKRLACAKIVCAKYSACEQSTSCVCKVQRLEREAPGKLCLITWHEGMIIGRNVC